MPFLKYAFLPIILVIAYVSMLSAVFQSASAQASDVELVTNGHGFAVVELFTSEGCSSCPPAEAHLNDLSDFAKNNPAVALYPLAFHVDYWDYLGWKDDFADEKFTARQRNYAAKQKRRSVYTPQMIVNGGAQFVGSKRRDGTPIINDALQTPKPNAPVLSISNINNNEKGLTVDYTLDGDIKNQHAILIAVVENDLATQVKRGENRGKMLTHQNVVRHLTTEKAQKKDSVAVAYTGAGKLSVIAFVQDRRSFEIIAATQRAL